jgi:hypothetical protein
MTKTFWVASNSPIPNQMAASHNQRGESDGVRVVSISSIVFYVLNKKATMQPIARGVQPTV